MKKGFTLVEVLVVVVIVGILSAIIFTTVTSTPKANNTGTDSSLQSTVIPGQNIPVPTGYVNDTAHVLSATTVSDNEKKLSAFASQGGSVGEIAVLTVPSLNGLTIEEYGIRVAEAWKVGKYGQDNGNILIISSGDRKVRIETGSASEITDGQAKQILNDSIVPFLKKNDWDGGVNSGVDAIMKTMTSK